MESNKTTNDCASAARSTEEQSVETKKTMPLLKKGEFKGRSSKALLSYEDSLMHWGIMLGGSD